MDRVKAFLSNAAEKLSKRVEKTLKVNFFSHFYTIKEFLPQMIEVNEGHFVILSLMHDIDQLRRLERTVQVSMRL